MIEARGSKAFSDAGAFVKAAGAQPVWARSAPRRWNGTAPRGMYRAGVATVVRKFVACKFALAELPDGPYLVLASYLDATALCKADATCRIFRQLNCSGIGPWRSLGLKKFFGLELEREGTFELPAVSNPMNRRWRFSGATSNSRRKVPCVDWKTRFQYFCTNVPTFCSPFNGPLITSISQLDEVAYFQCRLCTDIIDESSSVGVYLEVEVQANCDNLSIAITDFEAGGCSSVTFSPDTGAVIRERKVREAPRRVEGAYIQPLPIVPPGSRFHGFVGLYLQRGRLAFFRRCNQTSMAHGQAKRGGLGAWESTGFISDLSWAEGRRLTPCLAFRDEGAYRVRVVTVASEPPFALEPFTSSEATNAAWSGFDWEVGALNMPENAAA